MRFLVAKWNRFWFEPTSQYQFGVFRILFMVWFIAADRADRPLSVVLYPQSPELMEPQFPVALLNALGELSVPYPIPEEYRAMVVAAFTLLLWTSLVGILTRPSLALLAVANLYFEGLHSSFGLFSHATSLPSLALLVLAAAPGSTSWSGDGVLLWFWRNVRHRGSFKSDLFRSLAGPAVAPWGPRLILVLLAIVYFASGVSKLRHSGLQWADGETLNYYLSGKSITNWTQFVADPAVLLSQDWRDGVGVGAYLYRAIPTPPGVFIARHRALTCVLSILTLLFELGFPLVFCGRRWRIFFLLAGVGFHTGTAKLMGIPFWGYTVMYLAVIDWRGALEATLRRGKSRPSRSCSKNAVRFLISFSSQSLFQGGKYNSCSQQEN